MTRLLPSPPFSGRLFVAGALLAVLPAGLRASDWQSLLTNTPFGQAPAAATTATSDPEFRGVVEEGGVYLVNLYNPATKTAQWIPVNGQVPGLEVKSYDAGSDKVQITQAGRSLTLQLKQARVVLAAAPVAAPPKNENAGSPDNPDKEDKTDHRALVREMIRARLEGGGPAGPGGPSMRNLPADAQAMIDEFRRRRAEASAQSRRQRQP